MSALAPVLAAASAGSFPILPSLIFVPMVGALLIALLPRTRPDLARLVAIVASLTAGILSIVLLVQF